MKNKIEDLRNHLFETIEALRDETKPLAIERAMAIADVAQVIVNSAKIENDFIKLTRSKGSGFIPIDKQITSGGGPVIQSPAQRQIQAPEGFTRNGRSSLPRCPDPNCGGMLSPETNGNGLLRDVCDKCRRAVAA